jgi:hypothetical protein
MGVRDLLCPGLYFERGWFILGFNTIVVLIGFNCAGDW